MDGKSVQWLLTHIWHELQRLVELELRRFARPLEALINELLARPMPADWRKRLGDHLDLWDDKGFEVAPEHRRVLEDFVEAWGRARGVLPAAVLDETYDPESFAGLGSARGGFDFLLAQLPATLTDEQINAALRCDPYTVGSKTFASAGRCLACRLC